MKGAETANFVAKLTRAWVFWGCCRFWLGMPSDRCLYDIIQGMHANGGVLIMVGLGERVILRGERG